MGSPTRLPNPENCRSHVTSTPIFSDNNFFCSSFDARISVRGSHWGQMPYLLLLCGPERAPIRSALCITASCVQTQDSGNIITNICTRAENQFMSVYSSCITFRTTMRRHLTQVKPMFDTKSRIILAFASSASHSLVWATDNASPCEEGVETHYEHFFVFRELGYCSPYRRAAVNQISIFSFVF